MSAPPATVADFKARYVRDFKYGTGFETVTDADISQALLDAASYYNPNLFTTVEGKAAFLYASAHFLAVNVQAAGGLQAGPTVGEGINNDGQEIITQRNVGSVSFSVMEPPVIIAKCAALRQFWTTDYGRRYIALLQPKLVGVTGAVEGPLQSDIEDTPPVPYSENS